MLFNEYYLLLHAELAVIWLCCNTVEYFNFWSSLMLGEKYVDLTKNLKSWILHDGKIHVWRAKYDTSAVNTLFF